MSGDTEPDRPPARSLRSVDSFFYMLQADAENRTRAGVLEQLRNCDADLLIIDVSFDGSEESRWSPGELRSIAEGKRGRKILAYFSVGEAEDFRAYWREDWDRNRDGKPDAAAPEFLQLANEDWAGSYNVKFWDAEWKTIIFQDLDSIIARGFDGIFLDRVDAFEDQEQTESGEYESGRINPQSNQSFRNDMLDFIYSLAGRARTQSRDFLIVPQNGTQLLDDPRYVELIDGITLEELLFFDNAPSDAEERVKVLERVSRLSDQKPVLLVEYVRPEFRDECLAKAKELGFKILITDRDLETFDAIK